MFYRVIGTAAPMPDLEILIRITMAGFGTNPPIARCNQMSAVWLC